MLGAGFLLEFSCGIVYTVGNMTPYIVSYIRQHSHPQGIRFVDANLLLASQVVPLAIAYTPGALIEEKLGPRVTMLIGAVVMNVGIFLTYLTIQKSFWLVLVSYGFMLGFGSGLITITPISCGLRWLPKRKGLASGIVISGWSLSPLAFTLIQTSFINPNNFSPNNSPFPGSTEVYFTQEELLNRVPFVFLLLGAVCALIQLVGCVFLVNPSNEECDSAMSNGELSLREITVGKASVSSLNTTCTASDADNSSQQPKRNDGSPQDMSPLQILRTPKFYCLSAMYGLVWTSIDGLAGIYKNFAFEEVTGDDHFLSIVGSVGSIFYAANQPFWGWMADFFGYGFAFVVQGAILTSSLFTFYASSVGGKAMFFIWYSLILSSSGSSIYPKAVSEMFGKSHVGGNTALLYSVQVLSGIVATFVPYLLLEYIHWYGLLFILAGLSLLQFCLAIILSFL